ncbi:MAG: dTDP-glucose 4,6-dehydratase [Candidatus Omnitrophica bacterium CG11_big_fil_rev_8_21_14_0_20_42_13]|uniref:dTDP-glucose 4,6-dehydratase n=1 Tax=Candidatus Ghiorseimicrobium undicola TaxID=1974746 RepID=A0A2H0LY84_9BACT|nr:MAG: dTDP-glucose 4,6-dehydratase [Candidatus Omnitrophica bacterium CG11_big_fil_rev_8_21_14_0_20_42_13]
MTMKKKILITGGCGFIGSNFIRYMLDKYPDYNIINIDKLTYAGKGENLKDKEGDSRYKFIHSDICEAPVVDKIVKGCDIIVHFAAESHVDRSILCSDAFVRTNVFGTHVLLEAAKRHNVSRYIQISTDECYGSIKKGSFTENSPILPNSPYSASKAAADLLARSYFVTHGLPVIITRSSNNFGPWQYPEKVIPLFITNLLEGKKVPLYGDGLNVRDWIFVLDNCAGIDLVMRNGKAGEVYNIGGGSEITNLELTRLILKKMGKGEESISYVSDRAGHDRRYSLNCAKIKKLGFRPKYDFKQALDLTIDWYKNNKPWWQKLKSKNV